VSNSLQPNIIFNILASVTFHLLRNNFKLKTVGITLPFDYCAASYLARTSIVKPCFVGHVLNMILPFCVYFLEFSICRPVALFHFCGSVCLCPCNIGCYSFPSVFIYFLLCELKSQSYVLNNQIIVLGEGKKLKIRPKRGHGTPS